MENEVKSSEVVATDTQNNEKVEFAPLIINEDENKPLGLAGFRVMSQAVKRPEDSVEHVEQTNVETTETVALGGVPVKKVREEETDPKIRDFVFDFSILSDFCKVRNNGKADYNGTQPSPRIQWLMELCTRLGLEAEYDIWPGNRFKDGASLDKILQFNVDQIDEVVDSMQHLNDFEKNEEKRVLRIAFENFDKPRHELQQRLNNLNNNRNVSKAEKRIYKMMLRFKEDIANAVDNNFYNLYIRGTGRVAVMAHHDIVNPKSDNCNDNSASCINAIAAKLLNPEIHVIINDAEEIGGLGAQRSAERIKEGYFGELDFVLNLELTAVGGTNFFVEKHSTSKLFERIVGLFPGVELYSTPFHDGIVLRRNDIDSVVINPLPRLTNGELNYELLGLCHSDNDTIQLADFDDMRDFVTKVVTPIIDGRPIPEFKNETNAPLNEEICVAEGFFGDDRVTVKLVETPEGIQFELKTIGFNNREEIEHFPLKFSGHVYNEWKKSVRFQKVKVNNFHQYYFR